MEHGAAAFLTLVWFVEMGAAQSTDAARPCNNQDAVKALLLYHHHLALQKSPAKDQRATCPVPHGPRGAMAPASDAPLNPLNNMPALSQDRAHTQKMELSRERVVSSCLLYTSDAADEATIV